MSDRWHVIESGGVLYGDDGGGATIVGVVAHWPHGSERDAAIDALIEIVRVALTAQPQPDELRAIVTDIANLPYNYETDTARRRIDLLVGRARAAVAGSATSTGDDDGLA